MSIVTLIAPLTHIEKCPQIPLKLSDKVEIHKVTSHVEEKIRADQVVDFDGNPVTYSYCLVARDVDVDTNERFGPQGSIEEIVLRLRLYKPGGIGFNYIIIDDRGWYDDPQGKSIEGLKRIRVYFYVVWRRQGMINQYDLEADDVKHLQELFELSSNEKLMQTPAFRFFFRSYHEPYSIDRFLSNAIGLENLLVNDEKEKSSFRYKFVDRGCFLLQQAEPILDDALAYVKPLQNIYDKRSAIVHSTKESTKRYWNTDDEITILQNSEQYLRVLLKYILRNHRMRSSVNIDKAKRECYLPKGN
jgi:hypothetical protein